VVETDAQVVTKAVDANMRIGPFGLIVQDIGCLLNQLPLVRLRFVKREGNMLAHVIAKEALANSSMTEFTYFDCIPRFISCIVRSDLEAI